MSRVTLSLKKFGNVGTGERSVDASEDVSTFLSRPGSYSRHSRSYPGGGRGRTRFGSLTFETIAGPSQAPNLSPIDSLRSFGIHTPEEAALPDDDSGVLGHTYALDRCQPRDERLRFDLESHGQAEASGSKP